MTRRLVPFACCAILQLVSALGASPARAQTSSTRPPQKYEALGREILGELIAINSTTLNGTTAAARAVAARALAGGFPAADVQVLAPADHLYKGNVVIRLRGRSSERPVLYICHLDVVEARREDWTFDPFKLTEQDGWLYGRGTIDMKGQVAAVLASLIRLKQEGVVPARDIIAVFAADEEGGDANGVAWLLKEHRPLVDAALVINPDGGEAAIKQGRKIYLGVQTSEKMYLTFSLETTDKGGHSSRPTADNPIYRLAAGLERLEKFRFPVHLTDTTRLYFSRRAELETGQVQSDMRAILKAPADPKAVERLSSTVETNIQLRTTCTTTTIEGGHAENALPQRARATVQCRVIPGESRESVAAAIGAAVADPKIAVSVQTPAAQPAPDSPPAPDILTMVESVTRAMWPGVIVLPQMSAGATDSIHTRGAGIPSYGIDAMFDDLDDGRAHGRDERINAIVFAEEIEFTYRLMRAISS
jgi:acetylornithine deacetylase/succinyl-diaminopimelate desuccinylase-like protein